MALIIFVLFEFLTPCLMAQVSEIKGSVFYSLGGVMTLKLSLAKVYLMNEEQAVELFSKNKNIVFNYFNSENKRLLDDHNQAVSEYSKAHKSLVYYIDEAREELNVLAASINRLKDDVDRRDERALLIVRHTSSEYKLRDLDVKLGVLQLTGKPKEFKRLSLTREYVLNRMTTPLPAMEVMTQTDADGAFVIDVKSNDKYLLIIGQGDESLAKWFLKIETLKKDGGKYLFSNQNSILSKDTRQVIEVSVDDSVSIVMNKNDTRLKK
jgi:hypothetical protein